MKATRGFGVQGVCVLESRVLGYWLLVESEGTEQKVDARVGFYGSGSGV